MKVAFLMRSEFRRIHGGDVIQVEAYCRELERMGYQTKLLDMLTQAECLKHEMFVLVNIDRPVETIYYWSMIKMFAPDSKVFVIPIHHPIEAINRYERHRKGYGYRYFNYFLPDFYSREKIKNLFRFRYNPRLLVRSFGDLCISYRSAIAEILRRSDGVIYISDGERLSVENDFGVKSIQCVVAHNAVELGRRPAFVDPLLRKYDVIVVGRIEPRKNQVSVCQAFEGSPHNVCFVGPVTKNSDKYYLEFMKYIGRCKNFEYVGARSHAETLTLVANSRVLLNASYFEVNPLVDLEAALVGTQVVTTKYSYSKESLPNARFADPWEPMDILQNVEVVLASGRNTLEGAQVSESWLEPTKKIATMMALVNV